MKIWNELNIKRSWSARPHRIEHINNIETVNHPLLRMSTHLSDISLEIARPNFVTLSRIAAGKSSNSHWTPQQIITISVSLSLTHTHTALSRFMNRKKTRKKSPCFFPGTYIAGSIFYMTRFICLYDGRLVSWIGKKIRKKSASFFFGDFYFREYFLPDSLYISIRCTMHFICTGGDFFNATNVQPFILFTHK